MRGMFLRLGVPISRVLPRPRHTIASAALALLIGLPASARAQAPESRPPEQLDRINVNAQRYTPVPLAVPNYMGFLSGPPLPLGQFPLIEFNILGPMVVTATRTPQLPERVAATLKVLDAATLRQAPSLTLDGTLRSIPGFSLFRRSDSFSANPTAQGVSLRGLGPSGASRSLVLLDGVPLNDPFGGWVAWSKLPREGLGRTEVVPGGGATAWGNAALGGVIQIFSLPAATRMEVIDRPPQPIAWTALGTLRLAATLGDYGTRSAEVALTMPTRKGVVQVLGRTFATDGFPLVAPERRGPIDIAAWSRHRWLTLRWRQPLANGLDLLATARGFEEKRGNGTPYQQNNSREQFVSLGLAGQPRNHFAWRLTSYAQSQAFASTFSGVNATRTAETPASDQFDVPASAVGAAWMGVYRHGGEVTTTTSFGADARFVRGETREHFTFVSGNYTRLRVAGGRQFVGGVYLFHERFLTDELRTTVGLRLDQWQESDGRRRESDRATGVLSRNDRYADLDGTAFSPNAGVVWTPGKAWRVRANAQRAFRRPTLNELYRPFRVGANITEANAALGTEKVTTFELGPQWTLFVQPPTPPPPASRSGRASPPPARPPEVAVLSLGVTGFHNDLQDAVGNVTLARGPGTFPLFGTIAAGGVGRQRLNLDRTRVRGLEFAARWTPARTVTVTGDYLLNDAVVRRAPIAPALVGNRVAQVPRKSAALGVIWQASPKTNLTPRVRWIGRQFEDDENQLTLGEVVIADLSVTRSLTKYVEIFLTAENLGNARIETGRSADGIVNIGTPRLVVGGIRGAW